MKPSGPPQTAPLRSEATFQPVSPEIKRNLLSTVLCHQLVSPEIKLKNLCMFSVQFAPGVWGYKGFDCCRVGVGGRVVGECTVVLTRGESKGPE